MKSMFNYFKSVFRGNKNEENSSKGEASPEDDLVVIDDKEQVSLLIFLSFI